jgi:hypothetical protein
VADYQLADFVMINVADFQEYILKRGIEIDYSGLDLSEKFRIDVSMLPAFLDDLSS